MQVFTRLKQYFLHNGSGQKNMPETDPESAYDLWALSYDKQPDNLMLALDEQVFSALICEIDLEDATVVDVGCGTGRHWNKMIECKPKNIFGFDISKGMLQILKQKYPGARTFVLKDHILTGIGNDSCDLVVSTLALAHIEDIGLALEEWCRVLKPGGSVLITDYHPEALAKGAKRTFSHEDRLIAVHNHIHSIEKIRLLAKQLHLSEFLFKERKIDNVVRPYYEKQNALPVFEQFKNLPIIYGIILKKAHDSR